MPLPTGLLGTPSAQPAAGSGAAAVPGLRSPTMTPASGSGSATAPLPAASLLGVGAPSAPAIPAAGSSVSAVPAPVPRLTPVPPPLPNAPAPAQVAEPPGKQTPLHIEGDTARYDRKNKIALASGHVLIQQEDMTITAADAQYDENAKTSYVNDAVKVVQLDKKTARRTVINAFRLTAFHEEKRIIMEQDVKLDREADPKPPPNQAKPVSKIEKRKRVEAALQRSHTVITAQELEYWTRRKDATFVGNVVVTQPEKRATADRATMLDGPGTITLEGKAHMEQIRGDWLQAAKVIDAGKKPDPELQRALNNKAVIDADLIVMDQHTNDLQAQGNVKVTQKGRVVVADRATYSETNGMITLVSNVRLQRENGDWLKADKATVDTRRDHFDAVGVEKQVESVFTVDESPAPQAPPAKPQAPVGTRPPTPVSRRP